ncbi:MAG: translation elongation factor Ts [Candidatus Peregrinibacteria bacterium]|nr:translation elongation factor Ts [Candidatus Peregrinibacteria bacterium]
MTASIELIKKLRDATGVSMTACKSALEETNGDFETAIDVLRKKGEAKAVDRAARGTSQGAVFVKVVGKKAGMVLLGCETDFVARGDDYLTLGSSIVEKLLNDTIKADDRDLAEVKDAVLRLGENIQLSNMVLVEGDVIGDYVHSNKKIGVLVVLAGGTVELARDVAMHVAATNPAVLSPEEIAPELVEREKSIWSEQLKSEGKPAEIVEKIMLGKEKKYREENALLKQSFVKNPDQTVEQLLKDAGATVKIFVRFTV